MSFRQKLNVAGYDPEEIYFYEKERELIKKTRKDRPALLLLQGGKSATEKPSSSHHSGNRANGSKKAA